MTGPEDSQGHPMDLLMPFVVVQSQGGPYEDEAFAAGWRLASIYHALASSGARWHGLVKPGELPQLGLIAMAQDLSVTTETTVYGEWLSVTVAEAAE